MDEKEQSASGNSEYKQWRIWPSRSYVDRGVYQDGHASSRLDSRRVEEPYANFNLRLFRFLGQCPSEGGRLDRRAVSNFVDELERLPLPLSRENLESLERSSLHITVPNLVSRLGREANVGADVTDKDRSLISRIWRASLRLNLLQNERSFTSYMRCIRSMGISEPEFLGDEFAEQAKVLLRAWDEGGGLSNYMSPSEASFALAAKNSIEKEDMDELLQVFNSMKQSNIRFQGFNWGMLAITTRDNSRREMLQVVWENAADTLRLFNDRTWGSFADACCRLHRTDVFCDIWASCENSRGSFSGRTWGVFANAAGKLHLTEILVEIWNTGKRARDDFNDWTWGAFLHAAATCEKAVLLSEMWQERIRRFQAFLGACANATGRGGSGEVFQAVVGMAKPLKENLTNETWGTMMKAAGDLHRPDILLDLLYTWAPGADTLTRGEHAIWGSLLSGAFESGEEKVFLQVFRELESRFDPTKLVSRGTLEKDIENRALMINDESIRSEILDTLYGRRCDVDRCLHLLKTLDVRERQFVGVGRCLMTWLYCSYFDCDSNELVERLSKITEALCELDDQRKLMAVQVLAAQGQGALVGQIKARIEERLKSVFDESLKWDEEIWLTAVKRGGVTRLIMEFYTKELAALETATHLSGDAIEDDSPIWSLDPLIVHIVKNQTDYITERKVGGGMFFQEAEAHIVRSACLRFSKREWDQWFFLFLGRMERGTTVALKQPIANNLHNAKRSFEHIFVIPLASETCVGDSAIMRSQAARRYVADIPKLLTDHRVGPRKPVNIANEIRTYLLGWRVGLETTVYEPKSLRRFVIAAWDGAKIDIIIPMFQEIRANAERALACLSPQEQIYQVIVDYAVLPEGRMGVLTVANACRVEQVFDMHSTGLGCGIIERNARLLKHDGLMGYALSDPPSPGRTPALFTWTIYFPLFGESSADESSPKGEGEN